MITTLLLSPTWFTEERSEMFRSGLKRALAALATAVLAALLLAPGAQAAPLANPQHMQASMHSREFFKKDLGGGKFIAWVSSNYLKTHPQPIPGVVTRFGGGGIRPLDASGCNGDVCIDIQGSGDYVNTWGTQAFGNNGCQNAIFDYPDGEDFSQPAVCPYSPSDGVYYDYTGPIGYYADGSLLCNRWTGFAGEPCETVHS